MPNMVMENERGARPVPVSVGPDEGFGYWLGMMLDTRGMSNADLARAIEVENSLVSKWRRNRQRPDTLSCRLIAEAFGVPVREVMIHAGHADPDAPFEDPVRDRLHELVDQLPTSVLAPFIAVFEGLMGSRQ